MGLCKCNRKKVTNLFCYEHRVNVCESCLVERHATCVVQSYLAWLQDSDYDPNCSLCGTEFLPADQNQHVRLTCLHVFHWNCLNAWAEKFPPNTAPAGYGCPVCQEKLFPKPNHISPIVDALKAKLQSANWARAGLGLPLLDGPQNYTSHHSAPTEVHPGNGAPPRNDAYSNGHQTGNNHFGSTKNTGNVSTAVSIDQHSAISSRKQLYAGVDGEDDGREARKGDMDSGENKYKRRSASEWFGRWIKSRSSGRSADMSMGSPKRLFFIIFLIVVSVITLITLATRVAKSRDEVDTFLDPVGNPNIRVAAGDS